MLFDAGRYEETLPLYDSSLKIDHSRCVLHHNKGVWCDTSKELRMHVHYFRAARTLDSGYHCSLEELQ